MSKTPTAEARLQKLKEEIALRKQQRQQKQENESVSSVQLNRSHTDKTFSQPHENSSFQGHSNKAPEEKGSPKDLHTPKKPKKPKKIKKTSLTPSGLNEEDNTEKNADKEPSADRLQQTAEEVESLLDKQDEQSADESRGQSDEEEEEEEADPNTVGGFSVLGNFSNERTRPVKRKLPEWLQNPSIIREGLKRRRTSQPAQEEEKTDILAETLDGHLQQKLHEHGIFSFFPVQRQFIPDVMAELKQSVVTGRYGLRPRDICVSAPTGSGKTLAYVLPIVQCVKQRTVPHVYAVVVLPVRDLAEQVYKVFCQYCAGTDLKVGLVTGKTTFSAEQDSLVKKRHPGLYHSVVDILVATPGRLVDHISSTPGFDLSHLRFLVIDEADRMMEDIKHDWLSVVETAAYTQNPLTYFPLYRTPPGPLTVASSQCQQMPLHKWLFSATLSHNPEKLERLNLFMPRLMTSVVSSVPTAPVGHHTDVQQQTQRDDQAQVEDAAEATDGSFVGKYTTPEGLTEYLVESSAAEKPLMVLHFLHNLKFRSVLCFTNTVEATHRLCLLLKQIGGINVKEFSSRQPGEKRKKLIKKFSKGKIDLLVCSDAMARGMDVDNVKYVISYDKPPYIKTYIHRVGRTARAGRAGTAVSLLEKKEFFHFKQMMREAGKWSNITEMKIGRQVLRPLVEPFQQGLAALPQVLKEEKKKKRSGS